MPAENYAWIVVADSARARIFSASGAASALNPLQQLVSPRARLHERDIASDRPGRSFDSRGKGRHAMNTPSSAKEQVAREFAREVATALESGRTENQYRHLVVVAEPQFLGLLNKALKPETDKLVTLKIDKDLSMLTDREIRQHLPERL